MSVILKMMRGFPNCTLKKQKTKTNKRQSKVSARTPWCVVTCASCGWNTWAPVTAAERSRGAGLRAKITPLPTQLWANVWESLPAGDKYTHTHTDTHTPSHVHTDTPKNLDIRKTRNCEKGSGFPSSLGLKSERDSRSFEVRTFSIP